MDPRAGFFVGDKAPIITGDHNNVVWHSGLVMGLNPNSVICLPPSLSSSKVFMVPSGIGDIAWVYAKLSTMNEDFVFVIVGDTVSGLNSAVCTRAVSYIKLLPKVKYVSMGITDGRAMYWLSRNMTLNNGRLPDSSSYLCFNYLLDTGHKLETILPSIKTNKHFEMLKPEWAEKEADFFVKEGEDAFCVYPSSKDYYGGQNLPIDHWITLVSRTADRFPDSKIVVMGTLWDFNMIKPLYDALCSIGYAQRVMLAHDRDIAVILAILRRSRFLLGCVSGLSIISEYQRIPTVHLYPKQLYNELTLIGTWESQEMISKGESLSIKIEDGLEKIARKIARRFSPFNEKVLSRT